MSPLVAAVVLRQASQFAESVGLFLGKLATEVFFLPAKKNPERLLTFGEGEERASHELGRKHLQKLEVDFLADLGNSTRYAQPGDGFQPSLIFRKGIGVSVKPGKDVLLPVAGGGPFG